MKAWTEDELIFLREAYSLRMSVRSIGHKLDRSVPSIIRKSYRYGLNRHWFFFSEEECEAIRKFYPSGGCVAVMKAIGRYRSKQSIIGKAKRMGLKRVFKPETFHE